MILGAGIMVVAIDWTDSKAVAIMALEICVFTQMVHDWSWKILQAKGNYPNGCIICLKSISVWFHSTVNKLTQIVKMEGNEAQRERNKWMVCSIQVIFNFDLSWSLNLCSLSVHHIAFFQEAEDTCPSIHISKAIVFEDQLLFHWNYIFLFHFFKTTGPSITS